MPRRRAPRRGSGESPDFLSEVLGLSKVDLGKAPNGLNRRMMRESLGCAVSLDL